MTYLGEQTVNQQQSPGYASPEGSDRPWRLLGVWNVPATDTLEVELSDGQYSLGDMLCAGDAMIHPLWPTVSIRADLEGPVRSAKRRTSLRHATRSRFPPRAAALGCQ